MATGGATEREERLRKRNLEKDLMQLREARRLVVESRREHGTATRSDDNYTSHLDDQQLLPLTVPASRVKDPNAGEDMQSDILADYRVNRSDLHEFSPRTIESRTQRKDSPTARFLLTLDENEDTRRDILESTRRTMDSIESYMMTLDEYRDDNEEKKQKDEDKKQKGASQIKQPSRGQNQEFNIGLQRKLDKEETVRNSVTEAELQQQMQQLLFLERIQKEREEGIKQYLVDRESAFDKREKEFCRAFREKEIALKRQEEELKQMQATLIEKVTNMERRLDKREERLIEREKNVIKLEKESRSIPSYHRIDELKQRRRDSLTELDMRIAALEKEKAEIEGEGIGGRSYRKDNWTENVDVKLNISPFSGGVPVAKNEVSFEDLTLEVDSVKAIYSDNVIKQNLRKSLRGQAKRKLLHMRPNATVDEIMAELGDNFGNVASRDTLLTRFLQAEQETNESLVDWGLRVEELLMQVTRKSEIEENERKAMLRKRFWRGLRNEELRKATRVHYESSMPYSELRNKVREEEYEIQISKEKGGKQKSGKIQQTTVQTTEESASMFKELLQKIEQLNIKVEDIKKEQSQDKQNQEKHESQGYRGGYRGGYRRGQNRRWQNERNYTPESGQTPQKQDTKQNENQKEHLNG